MVGVDRAQSLVGAGERVVDALRVGGVHAGVLFGVDHQGGAVDAGQVRFGAGLRVPQAPHAQPAAQRAGRGDAVRRAVGLGRDARVAHVGRPLGRLDRRVDHAWVGPGAQHRERTIGEARRANAFELGLDPVGDRVVAGDLRRAVALDELGRVRRSVALVEQVEFGIGCDGVVLVDDGRVHPCGEHVRAARVCGAGDVAVGGQQVGEARRGPHAVQRRHVRVDGLRLVGRHQRAATGIAQQHNGFHALHLAQPAHADADVDQRVIEQEAALVAAKAGVPAEEADAAGGHVVGEVVLGEVDLIVRGDHRHLRPAPDAAVVEPLARMAAGSGAPRGRRVHPDELPCHAGCSGCRRMSSSCQPGLLVVDRSVEDTWPSVVMHASSSTVRPTTPTRRVRAVAAQLRVAELVEHRHHRHRHQMRVVV